MTFTRRRATLLAASGPTLVTIGRMTKPLRPANADGTNRFRIGKSYRPTLTCTPGPIPSDAIEADAMRFEPDSGKTWPEGSASLDIAGAADEVVFVELIGTGWTGGSNCRLERGDAAESRQLAAPLRPVVRSIKQVTK